MEQAAPDGVFRQVAAVWDRNVEAVAEEKSHFGGGGRRTRRRWRAVLRTARRDGAT